VSVRFEELIQAAILITLGVMLLVTVIAAQAFGAIAHV
jgi:hypothetical protein